MKKVLFLFSLMAISVIATGCATIVSKTEYPVTISTNAPNANIKIRDAASGLVFAEKQAPLTVTLKTSKGFFDPAVYQCEVISEEKKKQIRVVSADFNPWFLGNFVLGGILGMGVDGISGAVYKLDENIYIHFSEYD